VGAEQNTNAQRFYARLGATDRGGGTSEPPGGGLDQEPPLRVVVAIGRRTGLGARVPPERW
jgi:hypothetical protein